MKKPTRKAALAARALAYSAANRERGADSLSWEDGYRAAMRDARALATNAGCQGLPSECTCDSCTRTSTRMGYAVRKWLRPLR